MVILSPGATTIITMDEAMSGVLQDDNGKPYKVEQVKDTNPPRFELKDKDGNTVGGFETGQALVSVTRIPQLDLKALRKQSKGFPIPKEEAQKLDEEIAKEEPGTEEEKQERVQKQQAEMLKKSEETQKQAPPAAGGTAAAGSTTKAKPR